MNAKLLRPPNRPPLIQIRKKKFKYIDSKYIYPIICNSDETRIIKPDNSSELAKVVFFSAPYFHEKEVYNVYVGFNNLSKANIMSSNINSYYNIKCEAIQMLRTDMEYYSHIMKTPLVIINNYDSVSDTYELSYFTNINKEKYDLFNI